MNRTIVTDFSSQSSDRNSSENIPVGLSGSRALREQINHVDIQQNEIANQNSRFLLQKCLGEFLIQELHEAIQKSSATLVQNQQKIEELEDKIRGYEDHIECLEQLVKELQEMLRCLLAKKEEPKNNSTTTNPTTNNSAKELPSAFVEISLGNEGEGKSQPKTVNFFDWGLNLKKKEKQSAVLIPQSKKKLTPSLNKRVDINDGSLNDFV